MTGPSLLDDVLGHQPTCNGWWSTTSGWRLGRCDSTWLGARHLESRISSDEPRAARFVLTLASRPPSVRAPTQAQQLWRQEGSQDGQNNVHDRSWTFKRSSHDQNAPNDCRSSILWPIRRSSRTAVTETQGGRPYQRHISHQAAMFRIRECQRKAEVSGSELARRASLPPTPFG